ncbi:hypothetical protein K493DRAFT_265409 [Basidiobolus meristosporus CBS 931.73]|uniref:5-formyltetrahydrofolate cyclo-ligase n=1 Tax=Basidiobolus meristosporus CBS 931.73 TaxID=1314790 RepID=A0A1Y1XYD6_9FUNG|nr:hypothetical protein K493DRAFT_265409 [Basidiobolus meristosporus CBS 931.73]|eukprot:ORX90758.1 hypothetical protein K493DRAFT_265409 [Basidiobolus meristosporus CBS 931.73]
MVSNVKVLKTEVRKQLRKSLGLLSEEVVVRESQQVVAQLLDLNAFKDSKRVSVYINMSGEIKTQEIIRQLFLQGKECFVPRCDGTRMEMLRLNSYEDYLSLPLNKWKIPEPKLDEVREDAFETGGLDLIIMPGLGFDLSGSRIGHGKGYYDRYLESCANSGKIPSTVALALSAQIVEDNLPVDHFDRKPDLIITPQRIIYPKH